MIDLLIITMCVVTYVIFASATYQKVKDFLDGEFTSLDNSGDALLAACFWPVVAVFWVGHKLFVVLQWLFVRLFKMPIKLGKVIASWL